MSFASQPASPPPATQSSELASSPSSSSRKRPGTSSHSSSRSKSKSKKSSSSSSHHKKSSKSSKSSSTKSSSKNKSSTSSSGSGGGSSSSRKSKKKSSGSSKHRSSSSKSKSHKSSSSSSSSKKSSGSSRSSKHHPSRPSKESVDDVTTGSTTVSGSNGTVSRIRDKLTKKSGESVVGRKPSSLMPPPRLPQYSSQHDSMDIDSQGPLDIPQPPPPPASAADGFKKPFPPRSLQQPQQAFPSQIVKIRTTEHDGVVSASIEETNRLRISLGLRPLDVPSKEEIEKKKREAAERKRKAEEADAAKRERLLKETEARLSRQKVAGMSLGQQLKDAVGISALDWVEKMRTKESLSKTELRKEKSKAAQMARQYDEDDEEESEVTGPVTYDGLIGHNIEDFAVGEEYTAVLADTPILKEDGTENEEEIRIENVDMVNEEKRKHNLVVKRGRPDYDVYGAGEEKILSKYDESSWTGIMKRKKGFKVDSGGSASEKKQIMDKLKQFPVKKTYSLDTQVTEGSDYFTPSEMEALNKKMKKKKKKKAKKAKKHLRQKNSIPIELLEEMKREEKNAPKFLSGPLVQGGSIDRGSRRSRDIIGDRQTQSEDELLKKRKAYDLAFEKSKAKNAKLADQFDDRDIKNVKIKREGRSVDPSIILAQKEEEQRKLVALRRAAESDIARSILAANDDAEDEEDLELVQALENARKRELDLKSKKRKDMVAEKMKEIVASRKRKRLEEGEEVSALRVFTDAADFCSGLQVDGGLALEDLEQGDHAPVVVDTENKTTESKQSRWSEVDTDAPTSVKPEKDKDDGRDGSFLDAEPLASGGMIEVLQLVRRKGLIEQDIDRDVAGRANDEKPGWLNELRGVAPSIRLQYDDEFGRPMTRKEAFRTLSHRFHGKGPGKAKQEKRLKEFRAQKRLRYQDRSDTPLGSLANLQNAHRVAGQAYVLLEGGKKTTLPHFDDSVMGGDTVTERPRDHGRSGGAYVPKGKKVEFGLAGAKRKLTDDQNPSSKFQRQI